MTGGTATSSQPRDVLSRVLIVDDTPEIHADFQKILAPSRDRKARLTRLAADLNDVAPQADITPAPPRLESALSGESALALVDAARSQQDPFSVAFVDVRMPPGLDGVQTTKALWKIQPDLLVVLCSAYSDYAWQDLQEQLAPADRLLILKKPFEPLEVQQLVSTLTAKWHSTRREKEQREELARAAAERRLLLENASDFIYHWDLAGQGMVYVSPAVTRITGLTEADWEYSYRKLREESPNGKAEALGSDGEPLLWDLENQGAPRRIELAERIIAEEPQAIVGLGRDVTKQEALRAELSRAQRLEALGKLASGVAHDFNNLLTIINGHADLLAVDHGESESILAIQNAGEQAAALTQQLLIFARGHSGGEEAFILDDAIGNAVSLLQRTTPDDIDFQVNLAAPDLAIRGVATEIQRALMNLIVNATDAMPRGGTIRISTAQTTIVPASAGGQVPEGDKLVRLSVADTGAGMAPEVLAHVFEPFFTTKTQGHGTGLGLSIIADTVERFGAAVDVTSELGVGTEFTLYFPVASRSTEPKAPLAENPQGALERILIVDDDPQIATLAATFLNKAGYHAEWMQPEQALQADIEDYQLLITDVVMPHVDGVELASRVAAANPGIPVLFQSGYAPESLSPRGLQLDAQFIHKPWSRTDLLNAVRTLLG